LEVKEEKTLDISSCKVVEPLTLKGEGELTGPVSFPGIEYKEKAKESLGTLELEGGTCAIAKKSEIKGVFLADEFEIAIRTIRLAQYVAQQNTKATLGAEPIYIFANMETSLNSNKLLAVE
jgi:hypothetical protein